jgi:D-sedoheptulose 7-phosphate isomerase
MPERNAVVKYIEKASKLLSEMNTSAVEEITSELGRCLSRGGKILICGNGGSASDASHFAGELVGRFRMERPGMAALALTVDPAVITAIGNDYGFESVFSRQVEALGNKGDTLIAITTGGTSSNVLRAAGKASEMGLKVIAFTSAACMNPSWADFHWRSGSGETSHAQEDMLVVFHAICYGLEEILAEIE